jgi:hypothetical protein
MAEPNVEEAWVSHKGQGELFSTTNWKPGQQTSVNCPGIPHIIFLGQMRHSLYRLGFWHGQCPPQHLEHWRNEGMQLVLVQTPLNSPQKWVFSFKQASNRQPTLPTIVLKKNTHARC